MSEPEKTVGALVAEWRQLSREARQAGKQERARALAEDANALQSRLQRAESRIQRRHQAMTGQWPTKRVSLAAVEAELATERPTDTDDVLAVANEVR